MLRKILVQNNYKHVQNKGIINTYPYVVGMTMEVDSTYFIIKWIKFQVNG
jgi:predicted lipase